MKQLGEKEFEKALLVGGHFSQQTLQLMQVNKDKMA